MSDAPKSTKRSRPLSIRFSEGEKARLKELAGGKPVGQFIRDRALGGQSEPRRAARAPIKDADAMGRLLGLLGQSRLANNLNQIAKAANLGSLPVTAELEGELGDACGAIFEMRRLLLRALGVEIVAQALNATEAFSGAVGSLAE